MPIDLIAILGPTASGKSGLAEFLGRELGGQLINSDASAFYSELSTGVTKPTSEDRSRIKYHLLDTTILSRGYHLLDYINDANKVIDTLAQSEVIPIVVGGSGLYARALLDGYRPLNIDVDEETRNSLRSLSLESALERLVALDPAAYERIDRQNPRRVSRALELAVTVGGPVPVPVNQPREDLRILRVYLLPEKPVLDARIARRTKEMWNAWVEEVDLLEKKGLAGWLHERKPIGYNCVLAFLAGELTQDQAIDEVVRQTRKLAKKQKTWLRKETEHPFSHHFQLEREEDWSWLPGEALQVVKRFLGAELDR